MCSHHRGALDPPFSPVHRATARLLPAAGSLRHAAVHRQVCQPEAYEAVVGVECDAPEPLHHPELDPLVSPAAQGAFRTGPVGDPFVGAPKDQDLHQLLEHDPVRDTSPVATERMTGLTLGQERFELSPDGLDDVWWERGHGAYSFRSGSVRNFPNDGVSVPALHSEALPIDGSSKKVNSTSKSVPLGPQR